MHLSHFVHQSQLDEGIERHLESELSGMRHEIESLTGALSQRNTMVNALSSKLSTAEQQIRGEMERRERLQSEIKVYVLYLSVIS